MLEKKDILIPEKIKRKEVSLLNQQECLCIIDMTSLIHKRKKSSKNI